MICANIAKHPWFINARTVAVYLAGATEANLDDLLQIALHDNKIVLVPVIGGPHRMHFQRVTAHTRWRINDYGLREPMVVSRYANRYEDARIFDVVCVPLTAFDAQFNRVGMGGGYYDRYFAAPKKRRFTRLLGVGFSTQRTARIKANRWDVTMHAIATEQCIKQRTASSTV